MDIAKQGFRVLFAGLGGHGALTFGQFLRDWADRHNVKIENMTDEQRDTFSKDFDRVFIEPYGKD